MKKITLLSIVALICSFNVVANPVVLRRRALYQHGSMRMPSITQVTAECEDGILTVNIQKYSGIALLYIIDSDGNVIEENTINIIGDGTVTTEVNFPQKGVYTLSIVLRDAVYEGSFQIQ